MKVVYLTVKTLHNLQLKTGQVGLEVELCILL